MIFQKETLLTLVLAVVCLAGVLLFQKSELESNKQIELKTTGELSRISNLAQESSSEINQLFQQKQSVISETKILTKQFEEVEQKTQRTIPVFSNSNLTLSNPLDFKAIKQSKKKIEKTIEEQNILSILLLSPAGDCYKQGERTETIGPVTQVSECCCCGPECPPNCCAMCGWCNGKKAAYIWDPQTGLCGCEH